MLPYGSHDVGQIVRWKVRLSSFMQEESRMLEESLYKDLHKEGDKGASFMTYGWFKVYYWNVGCATNVFFSPQRLFK